VKRRREELRLALAYLLGRLPESLPIEQAAFEAKPPAIPVGLPATLMERRPDIAEAERALMARNAEVGVAKAAYFPAIRLTGAVGIESSDLSQLTDGTSVIWNLSASLFQPVFNAGRTGFDVTRAKASYDEGVAIYRNRLLRAFREVESALSALQTLEAQSAHQVAAQQGAATAVRLAELRYRAGLVIIVEVLDAQRTTLRADREALAVKGAQLVSTVSLIKALGGGWQPTQAAQTAAVSNP
jgi:multidrug efflux system outer membrane protein